MDSESTSTRYRGHHNRRRLSCCGPLVDFHPGAVEVFLPMPLSAMFVVNLITAVLLFGQFFDRAHAQHPTRNCECTHFPGAAHEPLILSFPDAFVPGSGVIGKLQQTGLALRYLARRFCRFRVCLCLVAGSRSRLRPGPFALANFSIGRLLSMTTCLE